MTSIDHHRRWIRLWAAAISVLAGAVLAGCESFGDDFADLTNGFNQTTPSEAARMMLDQRDPENRRKGTILISNSTFGGADVYVRAYRDMVENEQNPLVLAAAIRALARFGDRNDALLIAGKLDHKVEMVRWEAAKGLQRIHNPTVIPNLLRTTQNSNGTIDERVAAAVALGQYPEDRVFQGLLGALDARPLALNVAARQALKLLTGQDLGGEPANWLAWYNSAALESRFVSHPDYQFPTYQRDPSFWEKMAFWNPQIREHSGSPVGIEDKNRRSTYEDEPEENDGNSSSSP